MAKVKKKDLDERIIIHDNHICDETLTRKEKNILKKLGKEIFPYLEFHDIDSDPVASWSYRFFNRNNVDNQICLEYMGFPDVPTPSFSRPEEWLIPITISSSGVYDIKSVNFDNNYLSKIRDLRRDKDGIMSFL